MTHSNGNFECKWSTNGKLCQVWQPNAKFVAKSIRGKEHLKQRAFDANSIRAKERGDEENSILLNFLTF